MNHKSGFNALSRPTAHRRALLRNLVTDLFKHERIVTTKPKALEARRFAEKLITRGKVDSVHNRRIAAKFLFNEDVLNKLFKDISVRMKDRNGGYTRILKLGFRKLDAAEMVIFELVDYETLHDIGGEKTDGKSSKKAAPKAKANKTSEKKPASKKAAAEKKSAPKAEKPAKKAEKPAKKAAEKAEPKTDAE